MTIDLSWRDVAALWGAGLSTFLAIVGILPSRPRFHVEPGDQPGTASDLTVRVVNPSKHMRFVKELWRLPFPGSEKGLGVYTDKTAPDDIMERLWLAIKSESEATVNVNCIINRKRERAGGS